MIRGGYFEQNGYSPETINILFYSVCVWSRIILAVLMALLTYYVPYAGSSLLGAGSLYAIAYIYINKCRKIVWWKLEYHLVVAIFAFGVSMIIFACTLADATSDSTNAGLVGGILGADVILAIAQKLLFSNRKQSRVQT